MALSGNYTMPLTRSPKDSLSTIIWPLFDKTFNAIMGFHPQAFRFEMGSTPLSTLNETTAMVISYYVIIFGGREIMRSRPAMKLNPLFMIHNFYLTLISGILLALFVEQLLPELLTNGIFHSICTWEGGWTDRLIILYYV
jgi:hypothetical protein